MKFEQAEKYLISILGLTVIICLILANIKNISVQYTEFKFYILLSFIFVSVGQFYRTLRYDALVASAATAIGLFILAGQSMRLFDYVLLPYHFQPIDLDLAAIDAKLGFVWASYATKMASYPRFSNCLKTIYVSCYFQIVALIALLSYFGQPLAVTRFAYANIVGGMITTLIWFLLPSSTPVAFQNLTQDVASTLDLVLNADRGKEMANLGLNGISYILPSSLGGIIGFPSFHTIMAVLVVWYSRNVLLLFYPFLLLNLFMLPATLLHGAHNLVDVIAGLALATIIIRLTNKYADFGAEIGRKSAVVERPWPQTIPTAAE